MELIDLFSDKSLGTPVRCRVSADTNGNIAWYYGRFYGRGQDGEGKENGRNDYYDPSILCLVTPDCTLVRGGVFHFEILETQEDLLRLKYYESITSSPYSYYLSIDKNGKFYKNYEYTKTPLDINFYPPNIMKKMGYLDIDTKLFGNTLGSLVSKQLGKTLILQTAKVSIQFPMYEGSSSYNTFVRNIILLSTKDYKGCYASLGSQYPFDQRSGYDTPFRRNPIKFADDEIVLHFSDKSFTKNDRHIDYPFTLPLGQIENGKFIPNNFINVDNSSEYICNNNYLIFIKELSEKIMDYKLKNRKPNLTEEDMLQIVKEIENEKHASHNDNTQE